MVLVIEVMAWAVLSVKRRHLLLDARSMTAKLSRVFEGVIKRAIHPRSGYFLLLRFDLHGIGFLILVNTALIVEDQHLFLQKSVRSIMVCC